MTSLRARRDFERVYSRGRRAHRDSVGVHAFARPGGAGPARVALAVKVTPRSAVARNRARRRLREAIRRCGVAEGYDIVVRGSEGVLAEDFQKLTETLRAALRSAGVELR